MSSRLLTLNTSDLAHSLYASVQLIPQTTTRAVALHDSGMTIGGVKLVGECHDRTTFLLSFENNLPRVLKIPTEKTRAKAECSLYDAIYVKDCDLALILVRFIALDSSSTYCKDFSPMKILTGGILMPSYICTLNCAPTPITSDIRCM